MMATITTSDGRTITVPDGLSEPQMEAALRAHLRPAAPTPRPPVHEPPDTLQPDTLQPGEQETLADNGSTIEHVAGARKYAVWDCWGHWNGYRRDLAAARQLAESLPGEPPEPARPAPVNRSPRAMPLPPTEWAPPVTPPDMMPWPAKKPRVLMAYTNAKRHFGRKR